MSAGNGNGRGPAEIRRDIEHTREELAQTAAALAERADVKARAHDKIDETKARITGKVHTARAKVTETAGTAKEKTSEATPASVSGTAQQAADTVRSSARDNPIPAAAIAGFVTGAVIGYLLAARRC